MISSLQIKPDYFVIESVVEAVHALVYKTQSIKQAIGACERALWQWTVCFDFQGRSERRKGHKSWALQMVCRSTKVTVKV